MSTAYDVAVVGAGHNGLVVANYLARAGRRVVVLEARDVVGGACVSEELIPDSTWSSCAFIAGLLRPEIIRDLELRRFGLQLYQPDVLGFSLFRDGSHLFFWKELDRTLREIERYSRRDAENFALFGARLKRFADLTRHWLLGPPPSRSEVFAHFEQAGEEELLDEFVLLSTSDLLDRYFESEHVKGFLTFFGMVSIWGGPSLPGTAYVYGHHATGEFDGEFGQYGFAKGGMGGITQALAAAARAHGAEIRTGAPVAQVITERGRAVGVALETGEEIRAQAVVSNADPKRTMLELLPSGALPRDEERGIEKIDQRGSMARIHLLIDELPRYLGFADGEGPQHRGHQMLGASVANFEKAWEAERRGELPDESVIEAVIQSTHDSSLAPKGMHTLTLGVQQLPYELAQGTWDDVKEEWADGVVRDLLHYAPNLDGHIVDRHVITPLDLERDYHLTGGNIFHAAMSLNQLFSSRPVPSLGGYRTPLAGLYLCGAGTHPGGGVTGAPGHNAAQVVLADLTGGAPPARAGADGGGSRSPVDRLMESERGRRLGYRLARQRALRPFAKLAARRRG